MSEHNEALADVLAEMKSRETLDGSDMGVDNFCLEAGEYGGFDALPLFKAYADRIEAAAKRERAEIEADALSVGGVVEAARNKPSSDAAAMREAIKAALKTIRGVINGTISPRSNTVKVRRDRAKKCVHMNLSNGGTCTNLAEGIENRMCYILEPRTVEYNLHEEPEWVDYCPFRGAAHFREREEGGAR